MKYTLILNFVCFALLTKAQQPILQDQIFVDNIATVVCHPVGFEPVMPMIELGSDEQLFLSFDDLDGDHKFYQYKYVLCNHDWTENTVMPYNQVFEGMLFDQVNEFSYSLNTFFKYTNYTLTFPNEIITPKVSGNYLIKVFLDDENAPVFVKRFMIFENSATVGATVLRANDVELRNTSQQINFNVNTGDLQITNPFNQINVVLIQNQRWDNAIRGLQPNFTNQNTLQYQLMEGNVFNGGNEFKRFDTRNARLVNDRVKRIDFTDEKIWSFFLFDERPYTSRTYTNFDDINGRFFIRLIGGQDHNSEADYAWVNFNFPAAVKFSGDLYLKGGLTNWQLNPKFKFRYNDETSSYQLKVFLKQGYFDYKCVIVGANGKEDEYSLEGNFFETENEYHVLVYARTFNDRHDRLVGRVRTNSIPGK